MRKHPPKIVLAGKYDDCWSRLDFVWGRQWPGILAASTVEGIGIGLGDGSAGRAGAINHPLKDDDEETPKSRSVPLVQIGRSALHLRSAVGLLALPAVDAATGTFVQARQKQITSGTVNSLAFTNPNTAGNLIVVYVAWNNTGPVALSDSRGNTYTSVAPATAWGRQLALTSCSTRRTSRVAPTP